MCVISAASDTSLWGKKVNFNGRPCLWQLRPDAAMPALKELTVCILLRRNVVTEWTGFAYKAPGGRNIELGLGGKGPQLIVWLFGRAQRLKWELKQYQWSSVCFTWSGQAQRLRTYINGSLLEETSVNPITPHQLTPNGTLTLGASHYVNAHGEVLAENGNNLLGEIGLFRIWSREWSGEELSSHSCADGDVVSWDRQQWLYNCPPKPDNSLHCGKYRVSSPIHIANPSAVGGSWIMFPDNTLCHSVTTI